MYDGANTNVIGHAGRHAAIVEAGGLPIELTDELDTVGRTRLRRHAARRVHRPPEASTRTPASCTPSPTTGSGRTSQYVVVGADGLVARTVDIDVPWRADDARLRAHRAQRGALRPARARSASTSAPTGAAFPYRWNPDHARPGRRAAPRRRRPTTCAGSTSTPATCSTRMNAYDDARRRVVLDVVRHPKMFARDPPGAQRRRPPRSSAGPSTRAAARCCEEQLDDRARSSPAVDERLVGRQHRCGYTIGLEPRRIDGVDGRHGRSSTTS